MLNGTIYIVRPFKQRVERGTHFCWIHPVVGWASVFFFLGANVGAVFDARHVRRIGASQKAIGALGWVEFFEGANIDQLLTQQVVFFLAAVAPVQLGGFAQGHHVGHPRQQTGVFDVGGGIKAQALHMGRIHRAHP
jgi:hypothetical protein